MSLARKIIPKLLLTGLFCAVASGAAQARTATFVKPAAIDPASLSALSTAGDNAGFSLNVGDALGILFDTPYATSRSDRISVFTLRPDTGRTRGLVRFGVFNNGSPIFYRTRFVNFGRTVSSGNLFNSGCSAFGGCDYVEIVVTQNRRGADGAEVDYVESGDAPTTIASPSPEPTIWALMMLAFAGVGLRMKALRAIRMRRAGVAGAPLA